MTKAYEEKIKAGSYGTVDVYVSDFGRVRLSEELEEILGEHADIISSFILSLACEGVIFDERFGRALENTIDALGNHV